METLWQPGPRHMPRVQMSHEQQWGGSSPPVLAVSTAARSRGVYGIERDDVDHIRGTFPVVNRKDGAKYGEERTRRLILERFDPLATAAATGLPYQTVLEPSPADASVAHPKCTRPDWAKPPAGHRG